VKSLHPGARRAPARTKGSLMRAWATLWRMTAAPLKGGAAARHGRAQRRGRGQLSWPRPWRPACRRRAILRSLTAWGTFAKGLAPLAPGAPIRVP